MAIQAMYKNRWTELIVCALVVSFISLMINAQNHSGIVIITSLASTSLALMVSPGAATNSIRSVFLSYIFALFISVSFGLIFSFYIDGLINDETILFFIKFLIMLLATLFLFGYFDAYHPPAIGAMLAYFIDTGFDDLSLIIYVPVSVIVLLASIKSYIYIRHADEFKWKDIGKEFQSGYKKVNKEVLDAECRKKSLQIAKRLLKENVDRDIILRTTKLPEKELSKIKI